MSSSSNAGSGEARPLSFRLRNIRKWKLSLILLSAAIIAVTLSAIFVVPTIRINSQRVEDSTQLVEDPVKRANFVHISSKLVQDNTGLRQELSCADTRYEFNLKATGGYSVPAMDGCDDRISFFDAYMIRKEIPYSSYGYSQFMIEYDGKYYMLIMLSA